MKQGTPGIIHRHLEGQLRAAEEGGRSFEFVASTADLDSHGTIIKQDWDLERYRRNPIVLWNHNRGGYFSELEAGLPIGKSSNVRVEGNELRCTITFATEEENPLAEKVFRMVAGDYLRTVSVGFRLGPNSDVKAEVHNGVDVYILSRLDLCEVSIVPVPSNAFSVKRGLDDADLETIRAFAALKKPAPDAPAAAESPTPEQSSMKTIEQLEAELRAAESTARTLETQNGALVKERDAALARAKEVEDSLVERDVEALVGVKITPAEKAEFVELARTNRNLFDRMVAQRSDLKLLGRVVPPESPKDESKTRAVASDDDDAEALAEIHQLAAKAV